MLAHAQSTLFLTLMNFFHPVVGEASAATGKQMYDAITTALGQIIEWLGTVVASVVGDGALQSLLPLWAITIAISLIMLAVRIMRTFAWGA